LVEDSIIFPLLNLKYSQTNDCTFIKCKGEGSNLLEFWCKSKILENEMIQHYKNKNKMFYWGLIQWKIYKTNRICDYNFFKKETQCI